MKLSEMVSLADDYQEAHEYFENNGNEKNENGRNQNKTGYQKRFGFRKNESSSFEPKVDQKDQKPDESKVETEVKQSGTDIQGGFKKKPIICFNCNKPGHKKDQCYSKPNQNRSFNWKSNSAAACQIMTSRVTESESDDMSDDEGIPCRSWPIVSAMKGYDSDRCNDLHYPLRGAAEVNKQKVKFLRDTGSSICIVKQKFVKPEQYTGETTSVLLADRSVRHIPNAIIDVKLPNYEGKLHVCVMSSPVCDFIIGNDWDRNVSQDDDEIDIGLDSGSIIIENSSLQTPIATVYSSHREPVI